MFIPYIFKFQIPLILFQQFTSNEIVERIPETICLYLEPVITYKLLSKYKSITTLNQLIHNTFFQVQRIFIWHNFKIHVIPSFLFENFEYIDINSNITEILDNFNYYRKIEKFNMIDIGVLLINNYLDTDELGKSNYNSICTYDNNIVVHVGNKNNYLSKRIAITIATHLGQVLGMSYVVPPKKECNCLFDKNCIMNSVQFSWSKELPPSFYSCSIKEFIDQHHSCFQACNNKLNTVVGCGNGIIDLYQDEECDCGFYELCVLKKVENCCDFKTCKFQDISFQCSDELCCENCMPKNFDLCRRESSSCDIPEFCDGINLVCLKDQYLPNGSACQEKILNKTEKGYCFEGNCTNLQINCQKKFSSDYYYSEECESYSINNKLIFDEIQISDLNNCFLLFCSTDQKQLNPPHFRANSKKCYVNTDTDAKNGYYIMEEKAICYNSQKITKMSFDAKCPYCNKYRVCNNDYFCSPYTPLYYTAYNVP